MTAIIILSNYVVNVIVFFISLAILIKLIEVFFDRNVNEFLVRQVSHILVANISKVHELKYGYGRNGKHN